MKFALRNYAGKPVRFFCVDAEAVNTAASKPVKAATHHIAILDVSGSMYADLASVKSTVEKVFTLDEFNDPSQKITLISYASNGDCRVHFSRVTVEQVMGATSPYLAAIRNLHTRGCTGISQALLQAEKLIDDGDVTCISLHTDGYANDPSPYVESQALMAAADKIAAHPNVFCNTIGYRDYCDFPLLTAIANKLSGVCQQARSAKEVYTALHSAQAILAGEVAPTLEVGIGQKYDLVAFVSRSAGKVLGGTEGLKVRGLRATDDATAYRYREVSEAEYANLDGSEFPQNVEALLTYARVQLALGNLNAAKYALISTRLEGLYRPHVKALVSKDIAALTEALEGVLFSGGATGPYAADYGLGSTGPSVLTVLSTLNRYRDGLRVDVTELGKTYKRRGVKKVAGTRNEDGSITPASFRLSARGGNVVPVSGVEVNSDTATANIRLVQDADLVRNGDGQIIPEVAGVSLKLKSYRNYTVVSDGVVNTPILPIMTSDKRLFGWLQANGLVPAGDTFDPNAVIRLNLENAPLVDYDQKFDAVSRDDVNNLVRLTVLGKILGALNKGESESFTGEQVVELKTHCLSPALYFSGPTTTPYASLPDALANGEVDTRNSFKVTVGTPDVLNLGKLYSGNAYLQRRFTLEGVEKPTWPDFWEPGAKWGVKSLSARTKTDAVDDLTYPLYAEFLGLETNGSLAQVLQLVGVDASDFQKHLRDVGVTKDARVAYFADLNRTVTAAVDRVFTEKLSPLAFYVGATGLVPDELRAVAMNAEQLTAKYPQANPSKSEREGTFYELPGGVLLSVYTTIAYFSTERGIEVAKALASAED